MELMASESPEARWNMSMQHVIDPDPLVPVLGCLQVAAGRFDGGSLDSDVAPLRPTWRVHGGGAS